MELLLEDGNITFPSFFMTTVEKGKESEDFVCNYLKGLNYRILKRNFRSKYGEIDIIASYENTIHVIEVKHIPSSWSEEEIIKKVNFFKQKKIKMTFMCYLNNHNNEKYDKISFDIACVYKKMVHYWEGAFE